MYWKIIIIKIRQQKIKIIIKNFIIKANITTKNILIIDQHSKRIS
jgi:hypothetical protein